MNTSTAFSRRILGIASLAMVTSLVSASLIFLTVPGLVSVASAQATHHIKVGGEYAGDELTTGVIWFNGYDPNAIVIFPGDTIVWDNIGGVHTVTSSVRNTDGTFAYDSSPIFTPEIALADIGPGRLLGPGSVWELDTSALALGTYNYFCKIHPGMSGTLTITSGLVTTPVVSIVAGFGDSVYAQQAFLPADMTVPQGTIVRWELLNPTEPHTVTGVDASAAPAWDSSPDFNPPGPPPVLLPGDSFTHTYLTPGAYVYFCKVHAYKVGESWAGMVATVNVLPQRPFDASDAINDLTVVAYVSLAFAVLALAMAIYSETRRRGP